MEHGQWSGWNIWIPVSKLVITDIPKSPGTYMIGIPRQIKRVVGTDKEGILDIGKATCLRDRIRSFISCASGKAKDGHMAGWRFAQYNMGEYFPVVRLLVSWKTAKSEPEAARLEARLLEKYLMQHMETPPLNYNFSWRHYSNK